MRARRGLWPIAAALALTMSGPVRADPPVGRQAELIYQLKQDCGSCHGLTMKGGLGPPLLPKALADKPDDALVEIVLQGIPDTPMPPWAFEISKEEAHWLIRQLKEGTLDEH